MWDRNDFEIDISFIRHGKTRSNIEKRYISTTNEPLCPEGVEQIRERIASGYYDETDMIFVSPMKRCIETAELIYPGREYVVIDELREMDFGIFEGKNYDDLKDDRDYRIWVDSGCKSEIPDGESMEEFSVRQQSALKKIISMYVNNCNEYMNPGRDSIQESTGCVNNSYKHTNPLSELREEFDIGQRSDLREMSGFCNDNSQNTGLHENEKRRISIICHGGSVMALFSSFGRGQYFDHMISNGDCKKARVRVKGGKIIEFV